MRRLMHAVVLAAASFLALCVVGGCGSQSSPASRPSGMMTMPDGTVMRMSDMPSAPPPAADTARSPTTVARMICSSETAASVAHNLQLKTTPQRHDSWSSPNYLCNYRLLNGTLKLSVQDLGPDSTQQTTFAKLRGRLNGVKAIKGMANFGLNAFETARGDVVFLKDDKTLWVNAHGVPRQDLPTGFSRTDVAYGVASTVIACWQG